ncbi:MAG: hypothetical protein ACOX3U_07500 [Christensenellales bacterium]|jgi:hypothetical protein
MNTISLPNRSFIISKNYLVKLIVLLFTLTAFIATLTMSFSKIYYIDNFDNYVTETALNFLFFNSNILEGSLNWLEYLASSFLMVYIAMVFVSVVFNLIAISQDKEHFMFKASLISFIANSVIFIIAMVIFFVNKATHDSVFYNDKSFSTDMYVPFIIGAVSFVIYVYHMKKNVDVKEINATLDVKEDEKYNLTLINIAHTKVISAIIMTAALFAFNIMLPYIIKVRDVEFFHIEYMVTVKDNFINFILFRSNLIKGDIGEAVIGIVYWLNLIAILVAVYLYRTALRKHNRRYSTIASYLTLIFNSLVFIAAMIVVLVIYSGGERSITLSFIPALISIINFMFVRKIDAL